MLRTAPVSNLRFAILFALLVAAGCSQNCSCLMQRAQSSYVAREVFHQAATQAHLASRTAPKPMHPGKGKFGDQIEYLGYDVDPVQPQAGGPVAITFHYLALKNVARDWEVFVHIDDRGGRNERINGDHYPVNNEFHTNQWKQGDYIADRIAFVIPSYQAHSALDLWMGFYDGDERLPISNPKECENDGNNRLLAGTLQLP